MKAPSIYICKLLLPVVLALVLNGCGGGSGGGQNPACMECVNIQRNWAITEDYEITTSTPEGYCTSAHDEYNLNMSQSGCLLTVVAKEGAIFNGKICGTDLSWSGSYTYGDGGTITLNTTTAKTDETGAILVDGNINWTYSDSSGSCNGISSFTGR